MGYYEQIEHQYGTNAKILLKNYHNNQNKITKLKCDTQFLIKCRKHKITPRFILDKTNRFIRSLHNNNPELRKLQRKINTSILNISISNSFKKLNNCKRHTTQTISKLHQIIPHTNLYTYFKSQKNSEKYIKQKLIEKHQQKYTKILNCQLTAPQHNPEWFINLTNLKIPEQVQSTLSFGPKFTVTHNQTNFPLFDSIADVEYIIYNSQNITDDECSEMRGKMVTQITNYTKNINRNKTAEDIQLQNNFNATKKFLSTNKNTVIIEADKGNTTIAMNRQEYDNKIITILSNTEKYNKLHFNPTAKLQKKNNEIVKFLLEKNHIDLATKQKLTTHTAQPPRCYAVMKLHKEQHPLRIIISNIDSPSYHLAKHLNTICKTVNEDNPFNIKNSFELKDKLHSIRITNDDVIASLDVVSMYERIPPYLVYNSIEKRWDKICKVTRIEKGKFMEIVRFCIQDTSYFQFNRIYYKQKTGLAIGGCVSTILADFVLTDIIETAKTQLSYDPILLVKYVDDILLIAPKEELEETFTVFNAVEEEIKFTIETEEDHSLPYLDMRLIRDETTSIKTKFYQKPSNKGRILNFKSAHPLYQKINTAYGLISRILKLTSEEYWPDQIQLAKELLMKNNYPTYHINTLINKFTNNRNNNPTIIPEQIPTYIGCNYIRDLSESFANILKKYNKNLKLGFKTTNTVKSITNSVKDKRNMMDKNSLIYQTDCKQCNKVYIGQTKQLLNSRMKQHNYDIKNKHILTESSTQLQVHAHETGHNFNTEKPHILDMERNLKKRLVKEMLHIRAHPHTVNKRTDTDNLQPIYSSLIKNKNN